VLLELAFRDPPPLEPCGHPERVRDEFPCWGAEVKSNVEGNQPPPLLVGSLDESGNVGGASAKPVDLGADQPVSAFRLDLGECRPEPWPSGDRGSGASCVLVPAGDRKSLGSRRFPYRAALRLEPETGLCLPGCGHSDVGDEPAVLGFGMVVRRLR
jgi:hypothetical protein